MLLLLLLGLYTKQSLLALPAATILLLALIRPAKAILLACALAATGLGVLLALAWATGGGVIRHWILYNVNPFHLKDVILFESQVSLNMAALIAIGLTTFYQALPSFSGWRNFQRAVTIRLGSSRLRRTGVGFGLGGRTWVCELMGNW